MVLQEVLTTYNRNFKRLSLKVALSSVAGVLLTMGMSSSVAQNKGSADVANYQGADRHQRLADAAKKEGELSIYTSSPAEDMTALSEAFEKKYGVKIKLWRAAPDKLLQRVLSEGRANRFDVDVVEANGPEMEALHREKMLQQVKSPFLADIAPQAIRPHGEWVGTRIIAIGMAYNTSLVKKEDLPKTFQDLIDPKWKGKLGIEVEDAPWFNIVTSDMGAAKGQKLFRDIVATNGISARKGHSLLANLVVAGEVPLGLTVYDYKVEQLKSKGAAIDWFTLSPAVAMVNGVGVAKRAPHPNAAVLFFDFMLTDGQAVLHNRKFMSTSKKHDTPLRNTPFKYLDYDLSAEEINRQEKVYDAIIIKQGKGL